MTEFSVDGMHCMACLDTGTIVDILVAIDMHDPYATSSAIAIETHYSACGAYPSPKE